MTRLQLAQPQGTLLTQTCTNAFLHVLQSGAWFLVLAQPRVVSGTGSYQRQAELKREQRGTRPRCLSAALAALGTVLRVEKGCEHQTEHRTKRRTKRRAWPPARKPAKPPVLLGVAFAQQPRLCGAELGHQSFYRTVRSW